MPKYTIKLVIEGEPAHVEAVSRQARRFLQVEEEGKDQPVALRPGIIRRVLRVLAPLEDEGQKAA